MSFLEKKKRKFGDRRDGILVKDIPSLNIVTAMLYQNRCENAVNLQYDIDVTKLLKYIDEKNKNDSELKLKFFHCFIVAIARTMNERRYLNRFVQGGRTYERDEISISFVAKKKLDDKSEEILLTYKASGNHNVYDIAEYISNEVTSVRKSINDDKMNTKKLLDTLASLPRILLFIVSSIIKILDFWGIVPASITDYDPSYSSVMVANLGSIGSNSAIHHLNNYGTTSIMYSIGRITKKNIINDDGSISKKDVVDVTVNIDERIADGFYLAKSQKYLTYVLEHPELLEKRFDEDVVFDISE